MKSLGVHFSASHIFNRLVHVGSDFPNWYLFSVACGIPVCFANWFMLFVPLRYFKLSVNSFI